MADAFIAVCPYCENNYCFTKEGWKGHHARCLNLTPAPSNTPLKFPHAAELRQLTIETIIKEIRAQIEETKGSVSAATTGIITVLDFAKPVQDELERAGYFSRVEPVDKAKQSGRERVKLYVWW
jgi:hypothetical protein